MNNSQNILKVLSTYQPHFQDFIVKNILHINNVPRLFVNNSDGEYDDISLLKSGKVDMIFPDRSLSFLDGTEVNISVGPVVGGVSCVFWNIYPNSSTDVINKGILSSLEIVNHSVFIFAVLLTVLALIIYFARSVIVRTDSTLYRLSIIKFLLANIKGKFGLFIFLTCSFSVHYILHLFSASFTTQYSIASRPAPLNTWSDLTSRKEINCSAHKESCYRFVNESMGLKNPFYPVSLMAFKTYIYETFNKSIVSFFQKDVNVVYLLKYYCKVHNMINYNLPKNQKSNFLYHIGSGQYFERLAALFYHKNIDGDKKRRIIRASYSGLEQKLWTVGSEKMLETRDDAKIERLLFPMCWRYEELGAQPEGSFSPITYSNFTDLMYLYLSLCILAIILFLLEVFLIKFKSQN